MGLIRWVASQRRLYRNYTNNYWALMMAVRSRRADSNQDGLLDEREFALLEGQPVGESFSENFQKRLLIAGAKD